MVTVSTVSWSSTIVVTPAEHSHVYLHMVDGCMLMCRVCGIASPHMTTSTSSAWQHSWRSTSSWSSGVSVHSSTRRHCDGAKLLLWPSRISCTRYHNVQIMHLWQSLGHTACHDAPTLPTQLHFHDQVHIPPRNLHSAGVTLCKLSKSLCGLPTP